MATTAGLIRHCSRLLALVPIALSARGTRSLAAAAQGIRNDFADQNLHVVAGLEYLVNR